jgi:hypothetical protein
MSGCPTIRQRAMQMQLQTARHAGKAQPPPIELNTAKLSKTKCFPPSPATESGKPGLPAARFDATEESLKRIIHPFQCPALQVRRQSSHLR